MTARFTHTNLRVLGSGSAFPSHFLNNETLLNLLVDNFGVSKRVGKVLTRRLGVNTRYHSRDWRERFEPATGHNRNPALAAKAVSSALDSAKLTASHLQYLIGHTTSPAQLLPPNTAEVADILHCAAPYGELRQACTGFANALQWASGLLMHDDAAPVAIVGSEVGSVFFDPATLQSSKESSADMGQWVNMMQMGDGAAAVVLGPPDNSDGGILESIFFGHIGLGRKPGFSLGEGGSDYPSTKPNRKSATFEHDFDQVKENGFALFQAGLNAVKDAGVNLDDIKKIIPHQANGHIGDWLAEALDLPPSLFFGNADHVGNLGSASIWVALHEIRNSGLLNPGDRVLVLGAEATKYLYGGFVYVHGK